MQSPIFPHFHSTSHLEREREREREKIKKKKGRRRRSGEKRGNLWVFLEQGGVDEALRIRI